MVAPNPKHFQREAHGVTARAMDMDQSEDEDGSKDTKKWIQGMPKRWGRGCVNFSEIHATYKSPHSLQLYMSAGMGTRPHICSRRGKRCDVSIKNCADSWMLWCCEWFYLLQLFWWLLQYLGFDGLVIICVYWNNFVFTGDKINEQRTVYQIQSEKPKSENS